MRAGLLRGRDHLRRVRARPAGGRCSRRRCRRRAPRPAAGSRCSCRARPGRSARAPRRRAAPRRAAGRQMPVSARASVDLPEAEAPITPSAWPGFSRKSSIRRLAFCCSGGTTVSWLTSTIGARAGQGGRVGLLRRACSSSVLRLAQPCRARSTIGQPAIACSTGDERAAEQDRAGDHRAGAHLALEHHVGAEAEHRRLQEVAEGLGRGGELADAVARGDLGVERAGAQLLPAGEHRAAHAERLDHLALLADGLGEGVALQRGDVGLDLRLAGQPLVEHGGEDQQQHARHREMAEIGMEAVDREEEERRPGHVEDGEEHRRAGEPLHRLEVLERRGGLRALAREHRPAQRRR